MPPPFNPIIAALPNMTPFVGPDAMERARGRAFRARLGANEASFGASPLALAAIRDSATEVWKYADPENYNLRAALARHHGVDVDNIVVGEGIDGLLGLTAMLFLDRGDAVVTSDGAYPTFNGHVRIHGGVLHKIAMRAAREDLDGLLATGRTVNARIIYVSNPNSPLGSHWDGRALTKFMSELPADTVLVLDEAYIDTMPTTDRLAIDVANPQVIRFRTFSKAYALAGARIGYAIGAANVIAAYEKVRNHYGVNLPGQMAALAALSDQAHLAATVAKIDAARKRIAAIANDNGLKALPSAASFVAVDCGGDGAFATRVLDGLLARDVFVRKPVAGGIDQFIRVSCGVDADLDVFAAALPGALEGAHRNVP